jgi:hypothetical protein
MSNSNDSRNLVFTIPGSMNRLNDAIDTLNSSLVNIWKRYPTKELDAYNATLGQGKFKHYAPIQYPHVFFDRPDDELCGVEVDNGNEGDYGLLPILLFVGFNPSTARMDPSIHPQSTWDFDSKEYIKKLIDHEQHVFNTYNNYFGPIHRFRTPLFKYHIDLFALWHTNQGELVQLIEWTVTNRFHNQTARTLYDFLYAQFDAVHVFLSSVRPSQSILLNAATRDVFLANCPHTNSRFSGFHQYPYGTNPATWATHPARVYDNAAIPIGYIHAASMLSGQRAMDLGSRERLEAISYAIFLRGAM